MISRKPRLQARSDPGFSGRRWIPRLFGGVAFFFAVTLAGLLPASAQTTPPSGAPSQEGRDPFRPLVQKKGGNLSKEEVALSRLKLVGILRDRDGEARALVETDDGLGYILRERDSILGGQVVEITAETVKFAIRDTGEQGRGRPRIVSIPLYPKE